MTATLPTVEELRQDLPGIWMNNPDLPDDLTFKLFGQCKKLYLAENEDMGEPMMLHALGYIAPIPFHLSTDNGFHPDKDLPPWCKSALEAILKSMAWCWLEPIAEPSPINTNFHNVIKNMGCLEAPAAAHASKSLKHALMSFGSTVTESGNGSIVLKHAMLVDTNEPVPPTTDEEDMEDITIKSNGTTEKHGDEKAKAKDLTAVTQWSLQNWLFEKVDDALCEEIINEGHWDVQPLAAYTAEEKLINPRDYKKELAGAIVVMSFQLKYALPWNVTTKKKDKLQCTTEIVQIRVVTKVAPDIRMNSPSKRAVPPKPKFGSPSKKQAL